MDLKFILSSRHWILEVPLCVVIIANISDIKAGGKGYVLLPSFIYHPLWSKNQARLWDYTV